MGGARGFAESVGGMERSGSFKNLQLRNESIGYSLKKPMLDLTEREVYEVMSLPVPETCIWVERPPSRFMA